ncbi:MAG: ThuA domain-containing protein, partial [Tannerellaceae bacterium]|nr:ThuA domain-containing protein [Tannerellaceae bacterium]
MKRSIVTKFFLLLAAILFTCVVSARKPVRTLIITGQNNHNWQVSHLVIKDILENSGLFSVDFIISPEKGQDMSGFIIDFRPYTLVVVDYNGDNWPQETMTRF